MRLFSSQLLLNIIGSNLGSDLSRIPNCCAPSAAVSLLICTSRRLFCFFLKNHGRVTLAARVWVGPVAYIGDCCFSVANSDPTGPVHRLHTPRWTVAIIGLVGHLL